MAKAKKSETASKPAAKKSPAKKSAKASAGSGAGPMVDTTLAAQNAARHLAAGLPHKAPTTAGGTGAGLTPMNSGGRSESSFFRNMKQGLAKPHLSGLDGILDKSAPPDQKKSATPFPSGKQVGHNQTQAGDITRSGVPRRTGG